MMDNETKACENAEIQYGFEIIEHEVHILKLENAMLARRIGTFNGSNPRPSGSSSSVSVEEGEILEFPYLIYCSSGPLQAEIQHGIETLESKLHILKWHAEVLDHRAKHWRLQPNPSKSTDDVESSAISVSGTGKEASSLSSGHYSLAPEFEVLLDRLERSGRIKRRKSLYYFSTAAKPKQQRENEITMTNYFRFLSDPDLVETIREPKHVLEACDVVDNPHPFLSIKHSVLTDLILDSNQRIRNNICSVFLRRAVRREHRYDYNELNSDHFHGWYWLSTHEPGDTLAGDIEVLCLPNQEVVDIIQRGIPIFEDRSWQLFSSGHLDYFKPDFGYFEAAGYRVLAWRVCDMDGIVPLWMDRRGFWISKVPVPGWS
ncbi:hypothetical protein IL306_013721 [Fusarium sp. DS 682]|nr:hypothetical protein IL306_013721 [Fusarium sp. DS 682]